jgi:drug/metabolite transporter (DMT)-like permease
VAERGPGAWLPWLVAVNVVWGASYSVLKTTVDRVPPLMTAALGVCLGTAALWLVRSLRPRGPRVPPGDRLRIALLGNVGLTANVLLTFEGIARATAVDASLTIVGETIFTLLLAVALGERADRRRLAAAALGVAGVALVVLDGADPAGEASGRPVGVLLLLAATLADAVYNVRGAALTRRYDALTVLTWAMTGTLPVWLAVLLWSCARAEPPALDLPAALGVLWIGVVQYTLCFWAWFALIGRDGASLGAVTVAAQPLAGVLVGVLVLAERPGAPALLGALVVVAALWTAGSSRTRP